MSRFTEAIRLTTKGLVKAVSRFPLTVICLVAATILVCYFISLHTDPGLLLQKRMFTCLLGAFLGVAAQFCCERWQRLQQMRLVVYTGAVLLIVGYYFIVLPVPSITYAVRARTLVAVFAMFCAYIWAPSFRGKADFNSIALTHFKSAFTSILYAAVLSAGCSSIIAAIDVLLFRVNEDAYAYSMAVIWIFFANLYYLSLLPHFNSEDESEQDYARQAARCPRSLEVLVSYIAIPLVAAYSTVLISYFIKILITQKWPSGQLGPMILGYSAVGLMLYILGSRLENRFAALYRLIFPKALILMVVMQLISVAIRLNAYGVTESRYYVALFGLFSLVCGVMLSFKPVGKNGLIALLAAGLAILSVLPPLDAFTVSRNSQIARLDRMLVAESVLVDGKIVPRADVSMELRLESTNILNYLELRNYLQYIHWLPAGFKTQEKMKGTFGFEPAYEAIRGDARSFDAFFDLKKPLVISGYDVIVNMNSYIMMEGPEANPAADVLVRDKQYRMAVERLSPQEVKVVVTDRAGVELVSTGLYDFASSLSGVSSSPKAALPPEAMTLDVENNGYRMRIVLQSVNIIYGPGSDAGANYSFFVLFSAPAQ